MPSCAVKQCKNKTDTQKKAEGISYHRFPHNPTQKEKWIDSLREFRQDANWFPGRGAVVCSHHFHQDDFTTTKNGKRVLLQPNAYPIYTNLDDKKSREETMTRLADENYLILDQNKPEDAPWTRKINENEQNQNVQPIIEDDLEILEITETPRKAKLRKKLKLTSDLAKNRLKKLKSLGAKYKRLERKYNKLSDVVEHLKKQRYLTEEQHVILAENPVTSELITSFKKKIKNKNRSFKKYPPNLRKFAVSIHFFSPAAYKKARQMLGNCLPHPDTISKWYQSVDGEPGFTAEAFRLLKTKVRENNEHRPLCSLVLDEMAIRQQVIFQGNKYVGYVDVGHGVQDDCQQIATSALVFMLVCMNGNWKISIGYFLVNGLSAEQTMTLIKIALEQCAEAGVEVASITFDGCKTHLAVMKLFGCEIDDVNNIKTEFPHPKTKKSVVFLLDPCHMLKLVRNTFEAKRIIHDKDGNKIKWAFVVKLNELQNKQGLSYANKLKTRHILFRNQIMKVKLAAQLLSRSVAEALTTCEVELGLDEFCGAKATSAFLKIFNDIFDILNSSSSVNNGKKNYGFKRPICRGNKEEILSFMEKGIEYIKGLKILVITKRTIQRKGRLPLLKIIRKWVPLIETVNKTGFLGFIICMQSLKTLYINLIEREQIIKYIATYRLSQDHIEMLFSHVRSQGGHNNNPNARQLKTAYKKLLTHLELKSGFSGNCIPIEDIVILNCSSASLALTHINATSRGYRHNQEEDAMPSGSEGPESMVDMNDVVLMSQNLPQGSKLIVGYIAGFIARSVIKSLRCEGCVASLLAFEELWFHKLIKIRDLGGLCYPSQIMYDICAATEQQLQSEIEDSGNPLPKVTTSFLLSKVLPQDIDTFFHDDKNHALLMVQIIVEKYTNIKLHHLTKLFNIANKSDTKRQIHNKLTLFTGV